MSLNFLSGFLLQVQLVTISHEGKITDVNEASAKVTGVSRELLIGII
jgi:PAS domain-containing protein